MDTSDITPTPTGSDESNLGQYRILAAIVAINQELMGIKKDVAQIDREVRAIKVSVEAIKKEKGFFSIFKR